jgi:hypothetical protein
MVVIAHMHKWVAITIPWNMPRSIVVHPPPRCAGGKNRLQSTDPDKFRTLGAFQIDDISVRKFLMAK